MDAEKSSYWREDHLWLSSLLVNQGKKKTLLINAFERHHDFSPDWLTFFKIQLVIVSICISICSPKDELLRAFDFVVGGKWIVWDNLPP